MSSATEKVGAVFFGLGLGICALFGAPGCAPKPTRVLASQSPEGGDGGGQIVAQGAPEALARAGDSHTGRYLKQALEAPRRRAA
jgi:hypothetical protein